MLMDEDGCCQTWRLPACQPVGANKPYEVDVQPVRRWRANAPISSGALRRPATNQTGFVYTAGAAGQTGQLEPAWPIVVAGTVTDGSITWTAAVPPAFGEDTIASVTWTQTVQPDMTLTITGQTTSALSASAFIGGGTSGSYYEITVAMTMVSGAIYKAIICLTVE